MLNPIEHRSSVAADEERVYARLSLAELRLQICDGKGNFFRYNFHYLADSNYKLSFLTGV
jgi:hypothetical protein